MDEMDLRDRWQYYISSYMRVEPTEGIDRSRLQKTVLLRNLPYNDVDSDDGNLPKPLKYDEGLVLHICLNSNKIAWEKDTSEYFIYNLGPENEEEKKQADEHAQTVTDVRKQLFREKMVMNNAWMRGLTRDDVQKVNEKFHNWMLDGAAPTSDMRGDGDEEMQGMA